MSFLERLVRAVRLFGLATFVQIALAPLRKAYSTARFAQPQRRGPARWAAAWRALHAPPQPIKPLVDPTTPGALLGYATTGQTVRVVCANATLHVTVLAPDLLRAQAQRAGEEIAAFSYAVTGTDDDWPTTPFSVAASPGALEIATDRLVCRVEAASGEIRLLDPRRSGAPASGDVSLSWSGAALACRLGLAADEHIYGLGEKAFGLDRRGLVYEIWNDDPSGAYPPGHDPLYLNVPFYIGLRGKAAYGVLFDNTYRARIDAGATEKDALIYQATGGPLRLYLFSGPHMPGILDRYTELTGRLRLPPLWALGYHQSRWSYTPDARVREVAAALRAHRIPCDAIHLDIHYMDGYRCFTWHPQRFPRPAELVAHLHGQGFKIVPLIDCGVKRDQRYSVCADGLAESAFCAFPDGSLFHGPVWPGDCYFPDFTSPRTRAWWGRQHKPLLDIGVDGLWNDMNEPTIFGPQSDTLPDCVVHDGEGRKTTHAEAHNVYGMQMARATAEGVQALRPDQRTFTITRAGWAGLQRYAMNWMGDNVSTWEHLRLTMPMVADLGLSGLAFTGPDVGGFAGDCTPELLTRWLQLGVFLPFFRNHTALDTADQEPWALGGEPYASINRASIELRYHLLPYIYTAFWQCAETGMPMLRPLALLWPDDERACMCEDEFMFGDALLVAPVVERGAVGRQVYLPVGAWYDWWSGRRYEGGQSIAIDAPLDRLPIFARAGSVVPAWPVMQYVGERPIDVLTLHVFVGAGESVLYEDDGATLAYQRGDWRVTRFVLRQEGGALFIERTAEGAFAPAYTSVELALHGETGDGRDVAADGKAARPFRPDAGGSVQRCRAPLAQVYRIG